MKFSEKVNVTWTRFPLRIPSAIQEHVKQSLKTNEKVKRSAREKRQITPGVYSCGHQVITFLIIIDGGIK